MTEKQLKDFTIGHKKDTNFGKVYLLPKTYKKLFNVPDRPVKSNCSSPAENVSGFSDSHPKAIIQESQSYLKDLNQFIDKTKNLKDIPKDAPLVTADVVGLSPSIPHEAGLNALKEALDKRENTNTATNDLIRMVELVLKKNYFEFNGQVKQQTSGKATGTKFAHAYDDFIDGIEKKFLETQSLQPLIQFRYVDDVFFVWTRGEKDFSYSLPI